MARLRIKKLKYSATKYYYESPDFVDGINILAGFNGAGKSTFSDLIYFGLGGRVEQFIPGGDNPHTQIVEDTNQQVILTISIDNVPFVLKRSIGSNNISVVESEGNVTAFAINRSKNEPRIFSDWLLEKLKIDVIELYQGSQKWKINSSDIFRLIYYNQELDPTKIFKSPDKGSNFISDSVTIRKAIFQILTGKTFNDYYVNLNNLKLAEQARNEAKAVLHGYEEMIRNLNPEAEDVNSVFINEQIANINESLERLNTERLASQEMRISNNEVEPIFDELKTQLVWNEEELRRTRRKLKEVTEELIGIRRVESNIQDDSSKIKKIISTHDKLNLFDANTCPYCLNTVSREEGKCFCGGDVDEMQYERFFYSTVEYADILKSKQKSLATMKTAAESCDAEKLELEEKILSLTSSSEGLSERLRSIVIESNEDLNTEKLKLIEDKIFSLKKELNKLEQQREIVENKEVYQAKYSTAKSSYDRFFRDDKILSATSENEMEEVLADFNTMYSELLTSSVENIHIATINHENYMPVINNKAYREASSSVAERLMYYFTLLHVSLSHSQIKFPRFLLIDTPKTAGVDDAKLKRALKQLASILPEGKTMEDFQVILTTGKGQIPDEFSSFVFKELVEPEHLLIRRANS